MPKLQLRCPFSKKACRECGLFRARHLSLCYYPQYQENLWNREDLMSSMQKFEKPTAPTYNTRFEFPEFLKNPQCLANLEDYIERRDG